MRSSDVPSLRTLGRKTGGGFYHALLDRASCVHVPLIRQETVLSRYLYVWARDPFKRQASDTCTWTPSRLNMGTWGPPDHYHLRKARG
jgi:hypothetical protein